MNRIVMAVMTVALSAGCGAAPTRSEQIIALTGDASAGATLYAAQCASCHGTSGGGTASGVALVGLTSHHAPIEIVEVLLTGKAGTSMASYAGLGDQQLADLLAHVTALK